MKKIIKRSLFGLLLVFLALVVWQYDAISYGLGQAAGQMRIVMNTRPVSEYMADPATPDSVKQKLALVGQIRRFAFDSLGIKPNDNYTTFFDQQGKPILWVVTACPPFELKAKEWSFPIAGTFSYKGFFDYNKALAEEAKLNAEGYETEISEVNGWSTLGWFKDPVLSDMLRRSEGRLANLLIHELTHGMLYIRDSVSYNENLASFVGDYGAQAYLLRKYGANSPAYQQYLQRKADSEKFSNHIIHGARRLDSLYNSFKPLTPLATKRKLKQQYMASIFSSIDTIRFHNATAYRQLFKPDSLPNNTYFMAYKRYKEKQNLFENEFKNRFNANFKAYLAYLKNKYPSSL